MSSAEDGRESGDSSQRSLRAVNSNTSAGSAKRQLGDSIVEESEADSLQGSSTPSSSATTEAKGKWKASESDGGWSVPPSAAEQRRLASDNYDSAAAAAAATANASPTTPSGNPFGDESEAAAARDSPNKARSPSRRRNSATDQSPGRSYSQSGKATPRRPIVTPGRAPSVRYHAEKSGKYAPAIVATDMDVAGREAGNPFIGKEEVEDASRSRYAMRGSGAYSSTINRPARQASASGLMEDLVEEPSTPTSAAPSAAQDPERRTSQLAPPRTSTSTSRFNEVGLDEDDAWSPTMEEPSADAGRNAQPRADPIENEGRRKPWWTELLCGCGLAPGADDEQTGKTGPE
ncbi:hypothetical protein IE81DRAFT_7566 [Ceraceosorus guamensis]|uniref:Uncharacterized protein n=1 Tax=Ceraceosorus guamensis TaxID=1522189 RepID=A0A316W961_9BASI|nr:hypothetical protein IE81DRAFT_7566 [Ceraceosorus guamensis]PWN46417.1 hypothetical protein IE81DRAFT_7566 [Ceraceosorus guamensis]